MVLKRVLVVNKSYPEAGLELLRKKVDVKVLPYLDYEAGHLEDIKKSLKGVDAVIWNTKNKLTREILEIPGPQFKAISTMSSGLDHIDLPEVKKRNLKLGNTPHPSLNNAVADIVLGLIIAAARRFKEGVEQIESGQWQYGVNWTLGQDISGSTVGIVGFGGIGQAVAKRLQGFDVARFLYSAHNDKPQGKIEDFHIWAGFLTFGPNKQDPLAAKQFGATRVPLDSLFKESDFVILSCPLTTETKHLINDFTLNIMKRNAVLVNVARGGLVDHDALYRALKDNKIFAAGLDVVTPEPMPKDHPLVSLPNCYMIPHMGSATIYTRNCMAQSAAKNVLLALEDQKMLYPVL